MDDVQFVELLKSLLQPDTEKVRAATAGLKKNYYGSPGSLLTLFGILTSYNEPQLQQLAAVEARKLVPKHWAEQSPEQKARLRTELLQAAFHEENALVRHSIARLISAVAELDVPDGDWANLPQILHQACITQIARHREVGVYVLFTLLETQDEIFRDSLNDLLRILSNTIKDPESVEVRLTSMLALSRVALILEPGENPQALGTFQELLPSVVAALKEAIDAGHEDHANHAFEFFQTLLGCDVALLQRHFGDLVLFMIEQAVNLECEDGIRSQALTFLMQCVRYRKLKVQGLRLGEHLTLKSLQIVSETDPFPGDEEDSSPAKSALSLLDVLASNLPPTQVVVPLFKTMPSYLESPLPKRRRAAILALSMCVEGAPDYMETRLKDLLPILLGLLQDVDVSVRCAALNCVARLADDLADDLGKEHATLIPAVTRSLEAATSDAPSQTSQQQIEILRCSCQAIGSLVEGLSKLDAAFYVPDLVPRVNQLFNHGDLRTRMSALGAVGSIAAASEQAFLPHFDSVMLALGAYIPLKGSEDDLEMRSVACDAVAKIASAVGATRFRPFVRPLMEASEEALHLGHPRLRETSYMLWGTLAKLYGEEVSEYLEGMVRGLFDSLQQAETEVKVHLGDETADFLGAEVSLDGVKLRVSPAADENDDMTGMDDDDDSDDDWVDSDGVSAVAIEKEIAVDVLGDVISSMKAEYMPYMERTTEVVLELLDHPYEGVRKAAVSTIWRAYATLWNLAEVGGTKKMESGPPAEILTSDGLVKFGRISMMATLALWEYEGDRATVTDIHRNLAATLKLCGPAFLMGEEGSLAPIIIEILLKVLNKRHPCQQDLGEDVEEEILDETSEYDWLVIETALDTITGLAVALAEDFSILWPELQPHILGYANSQDPIERSGAVGSVADCIDGMGEAVTPFTKTLLAAMMHHLSDEDFDTKANAVYAIGLLCEKSQDQGEVLEHYETITRSLQPLLHDHRHVRLTYNAAGCISRMIARHPTYIPLDQILPSLVGILPLKEDYEENGPIFSMITTLYQAGDENIHSLTPSLMPILKSVLRSPQEQLDTATRQRVQDLLNHLQQQ